MFSQDGWIGLESIGEKTLTPGMTIRIVNLSHLIRMHQIPKLTALAIFQSGASKFRAHSAVHEQDAATAESF